MPDDEILKFFLSFHSGFAGESIELNRLSSEFAVQAGVQLPQVPVRDRRRDDRGDGGRAVVLPGRAGGAAGRRGLLPRHGLRGGLRAAARLCGAPAARRRQPTRRQRRRAGPVHRRRGADGRQARGAAAAHAVSGGGSERRSSGCAQEKGSVWRPLLGGWQWRQQGEGGGRRRQGTGEAVYGDSIFLELLKLKDSERKKLVLCSVVFAGPFNRGVDFLISVGETETERI